MIASPPARLPWVTRPPRWVALQGSSLSWHPAAPHSRLLSRKQLERFYLDSFRSIYRQFPSGSIAADEAPDFLISGDRMVGIELTEWHIDQSSHGSRLRRHVEQCLRILEAAEALFRSSNRRALRVEAVFRETPCRAEIEPAAQDLTELIGRMESVLPNGGPTPVPRLFWKSPLLLRLLDDIAISDTPRSKQKREWRAPSGTDPVAALQATIDKKAAKLPRYRQQADEVWLGIIADTNLASVLPSAWKKHGYDSPFDRVLVLEFGRRRVIRLRTL